MVLRRIMILLGTKEIINREKNTSPIKDIPEIEGELMVDHKMNVVRFVKDKIKFNTVYKFKYSDFIKIEFLHDDEP